MNAKTPSELDYPSYLMNFPFTVDNRYRNNVLMSEGADKYDYKRAFRQFMGLYNAIVKEGGLVYLLPSEIDLQDLPYTANLGCYLPHLKEPTIIVSHFKSEPRWGEDKVGLKFFRSMRYLATQPPYFWEGEADLKYIKDNLYVGGYGIRTDIRAHHWFEECWGAHILPILMTDPKLYHFDCMFFPLSSEKALVATSVINSEQLKKLENNIEVIEVPKNHVYDGWTNAIRIHNKILVGNPELRSSREELEKLLIRNDFEPVFIDLGEFDKSGADLSCLVMHLNYKGRQNAKRT